MGNWCRVENTFTGEDVQFKDLSLFDDVKILPHKGVEGTHSKTILM